jgi:hypothetical protein
MATSNTATLMFRIELARIERKCTGIVLEHLSIAPMAEVMIWDERRARRHRNSRESRAASGARIYFANMQTIAIDHWSGPDQ